MAGGSRAQNDKATSKSVSTKRNKKKDDNKSEPDAAAVTTKKQRKPRKSKSSKASDPQEAPELTAPTARFRLPKMAPVVVPRVVHRYSDDEDPVDMVESAMNVHHPRAMKPAATASRPSQVAESLVPGETIAPSTLRELRISSELLRRPNDPLSMPMRSPSSPAKMQRREV